MVSAFRVYIRTESPILEVAKAASHPACPAPTTIMSASGLSILSSTRLQLRKTSPWADCQFLANKYKRTDANIKSYSARVHRPELSCRAIACMTATIVPSLEVYHIEIGDYSFAGPETP
jgi:hypothetical protein